MEERRKVYVEVRARHLSSVSYNPATNFKINQEFDKM